MQQQPKAGNIDYCNKEIKCIHLFSSADKIVTYSNDVERVLMKDTEQVDVSRTLILVDMSQQVFSVAGEWAHFSAVTLFFFLKLIKSMYVSQEKVKNPVKNIFPNIYQNGYK